MLFVSLNRELNRTEPVLPVLSCSVPVPVRFWHRLSGSILGSQKKVGEPDWTELRQHYFLLTTRFRKMRWEHILLVICYVTTSPLMKESTMSQTTHMNNMMRRSHSLLIICHITTILPCMKCEMEGSATSQKASVCYIYPDIFLFLFVVYWLPVSAWWGGNTPSSSATSQRAGVQVLVCPPLIFFKFFFLIIMLPSLLAWMRDGESFLLTTVDVLAVQ